MPTLDRYQSTNLYLIRGLPNTWSARFAFVAPPGDQTPSLSLEDSWDRGFYAFFPSGPPGGPHPFLRAEVGEMLWTAFTRTPDARIRWFTAPDQPIEPVPLFDSERFVQSDTPIEFSNFIFIIPAGTQLGFDSAGFTFLGAPVLDGTGAEGPFAASTPTDRFSLPLLDDSPPPSEQRAVSAFRFYLEMRPGDSPETSDFDALDCGLYFFTRGDVEYHQRRFAVFKPLDLGTGPEPTPMVAFLDRLAPLDDQHTFFAFTPDQPGAATVGTHLRTTLGKVPTLAPLPPDLCWENTGQGWMTRRPRLVFAYRPDDYGVPRSSAPWYLAPAGRFWFGEAIPVPGDVDRAPAVALRLLCGNAGTEYVVFRRGDQLSFHPGLPACYRRGSASLTDENGLTLTSWVSVQAGQGAPLPRYRTQPGDAPLYTPAYDPLPGDPDEGSPVPGISGVFDFQQVPNRELTDAAVFPLVSAAGYRPHVYPGESPADRRAEYLWIEARVLSPIRRGIIRGDGRLERISQSSQPLRLLVDDLQPTVTPQGLLVRLNPSDKAYRTVVLATSEPPEDPTIPDPFQFEDVFRDQDFVEALKQNKLFAVLTGNPAGVTFNDQISILGWVFTVPFGLLTNGKRSMLIFKFYDRPLAELAFDTDLWAKGASFTPNLIEAQAALIDWVREIDTQYAAEATAPVKLYAGIYERIHANDWNGLLAVNVDLDGRSLPEALQGLAAGIDLRQFKADHIGIDGNRYTDAAPLALLRSSLFALVDYDRRNTAPAAPDHDFGYRVTLLQALFENSALTQFKAEVELGVKKVFKQNTDNPAQPLTLVGSYERRKGEDGRDHDVYAFTYDREKDPHTFTFTNGFIRKLRINSVRMTTVSGPLVTARFAIAGGLQAGSTAAKYFCVTDLRFTDLAVEFQFPLDHPENVDVTAHLGLVQIVLSDTSKCDNTLLSLFPLELKSFYFAPDDTPLDLPQIGFLPLVPTGGATGIDWDYGLSFNVDLGSLGALVASVRGFNAEVFTGWKAAAPDQVTLGFRLPNGRKELSIEGVLKLIIQDFEMVFKDFGQLGVYYAILLKGCRLEILGKSFPPLGSGLDLYLFPDPKNPFGHKVGWFGGLSPGSGPVCYAGLGQRVKVTPAPGDLLTFDTILDALRDLTEHDPWEITNYDDASQWTIAFDFRPLPSLRLGMVFNDPSFYVFLIDFGKPPARRCDPLDASTLRVEVAYRKIADDLGEYFADVGLPDALQEISVGVATITLPRFGVEVYTNGDYRVDVGFPARLDFSRSFKLQILPFIGAGGFYAGQLSGRTSTLLPGDDLTVAVFGLGLRVGLGTEQEYGIFRFGVSVSLYGLLEGALGYLPGNTDFRSPDRYKLVGRVGILAQLYGHVDFGIVKAAVTIVIEAGLPFTLQSSDPKFQAPYIETNVHVELEVVIGRIRVFGKKIEITVTLTFDTQLRLAFPLREKGTALAVRPRPLVTQLSWDPTYLQNLYRVFPSVTAPQPLVLYFTPGVTVAPAGGLAPRHLERRRTVGSPLRHPRQEHAVAAQGQMLALLAIRHGTATTPDADFDRLAAALWVGAVKCLLQSSTDNPASLPVTRAQLEELCDHLDRPNTLARASVSYPLDYDRIKQILRDNFVVRVVKVPGDTSPGDVTFFPVIPDLRLRAEAENLQVDFWTHNPKDDAYQDAIDTLFARLFVRFDPLPPSSPAPRPQVVGTAFATLAFEQFFHYLVASAARLYLRRLEAAGVDQATVGELVNNTLRPAGPNPPQPMRFDQLAGACGSNFYSGLRLPITDSPHPDLASFYVQTGQQFPIAQRGDAGYPVSLEQGGDPSWPEIGSGDEEPVYGRPPAQGGDPEDGLDPGALATLEQVAADWLGQLVDQTTFAPLAPLQRNEQRFTFPEVLRWETGQGPAASATLLPFPPSLRRTLSELGGADGPGLDMVKVRLFQVNNAGTAPDRDDALLLAGVRWATVVRLTIRRVGVKVDNQPAATYQPFTYELAGATQDQRLLLDGLRLADPTFLRNTSLSLLYPPAQGDGQGPAFVSELPGDLDVLLFKTDLSTDSRPPQASSMMRVPISIPVTDRPVAASLSPDDRAAFVRLVWECCIVNSGGYYLRYRRISDGGDPLAALFTTSDKADLHLLVEYPASVLSPDEPLSRAFINAAIAPAPVSDAQSQPVYVKVERSYQQNGQTQWARLGVFEATMPPGSLGFTAARGRYLSGQAPADTDSPEVKARFDIDNLYSRLAYAVDPLPSGHPPEWEDVPVTLPIPPVLRENPATGTPDPSVWHYDHVLPLIRSGNPYAGVGGTVTFRFGFRDVYGNEVAADQASQDVRLLYHDAIVPLTEWPGVCLSFDVAPAGQQYRVVVSAQFNPAALDDGTQNVADAVRRRYERIKLQYLDMDAAGQWRMSAAVTTTLANDPTRSWPCFERIVRDASGDESLLDRILDAIDHYDPAAPLVTVPLAVLDLAEGELNAAAFFPLVVTLTVERRASADCFPKVQEPWDSAPQPYEPARRVASTVGLPGGRSGTGQSANAPGRILAFAEAFEDQAYPGAGLKIAVGTGDIGEPTLWVLRTLGLWPQFTSAGTFAPAPLANELQSGEFTVTEPVDPSSATAPGSVTRKFTDIDLDRETRAFLTAIEQFLAPPVAATLAGLPNGRGPLERVIQAKRLLAQSLPERLLAALFDDGSTPSSDTAEAFRQRLLANLGAAYGVDCILEFQATVGLAPPPGEGEGVNLFGAVVGQPPAPDDLSMIDFADAKLRIRKVRGGLVTGPFVVLADARTAAQARPERSLSYRITHLEHSLTPDDDTQPYRPSRWLAVVRPDPPVPIVGRTPIYVPLREYPTPPQLGGHAGPPVDPGTTALTFDLARQWNYQFAYQTLGMQQDRIELSVELNPATTAAALNQLTGVGLFEALMNYRYGFPDAERSFQVIRAGDPTAALRLATDFADRVEQVAGADHARQPLAAASPDILEFTIDEVRHESGTTGTYQTVITVRWDSGAQALGAWADRPGVLNATVTFSDGMSTTTFEEQGPLPEPSNPVTQPFWWPRRLTVANVVDDGQGGVRREGIDVLRYESVRGAAKLTRNQTLAQGVGVGGRGVAAGTVSDRFVYRTPLVFLPDPLTPRIVRDDEVQLGGGLAPLSEHLRQLFEQLFAGLNPQMDGTITRRVRLETRFSFDPVPRGPAADQPIRVSTPMKLLPPQDLEVPVPQTAIDKVAKAITLWREAYLPSGTGSLVFGLTVYAAPQSSQAAEPSQQNKPTLVLTQVFLDMAQVEWS